MPDVHMNAHILIHLNQIVQRVVAEFVPTALKKHIKLSFEAPSDDVCTIFGHEVALQTLASNLIDNAIRYSEADTKVIISLHVHSDDYELRVLDQGPGIPQNLRKRVFERFYRIIGTHETGTGLGLNIVNQIVNLHKARISLETPKNGTGLSVRVFFPKPQDIHMKTESDG